MTHPVFAAIVLALHGCALTQDTGQPANATGGPAIHEQNPADPAPPEGPGSPDPRAGVGPVDPGTNLLEDPSFELVDNSPWLTFAGRSRAWVQYTIDAERAIHADRSLRISIDSEDPDQPGVTAVHGAYQEPRPGELPRYISGFYRVDAWERGAVAQYLQVVLIVQAPWPRPRGFSAPSMQIAVPLAGVRDDPIRIRNRRFFIDCPPEPVVGEWVFFEYDIHGLFESLWGVVPERFEFVRAFFEARYDNRRPGDAPARAVVRFDDVYLGTESRRKNDEGDGG